MSGKSRVSEELEDLRQKGLAKSARGKFKGGKYIRTAGAICQSTNCIQINVNT